MWNPGVLIRFEKELAGIHLGCHDEHLMTARHREQQSRGHPREESRPMPVERHRWLVRGFSFRQCVEDFRGRSASAMLFDDLAEEDDTLPVDQESRWIGRLVWCVPSEPVHISELVAWI